MTALAIVAVAEAILLVLLAVVFAGLIRSQQRAHARREDLMLNQLMHAVGRPWQEAPADEARRWRPTPIIGEPPLFGSPEQFDPDVL